MPSTMNLTMIDRRPLLAVLVFAACTDDGSLGTYPESSGTEDASGSGDEDTTASSTAGTTTAGTTTASTTDDATSAVTDATAESSGDGSTAGDTGTAACEQPGNCVEFPPPCGDQGCGGLDSTFDEDGCLRQACQEHRQCADGELCYVALEFGGCAPSGVFCEDDAKTQSCSCGSNPDCGGGFCVPQELYPSASPLPDGVVFADRDCAPNDGPAFYLQWGGFGECDRDERTLELTVYEMPAVGTFEFSVPNQGFGWYVTSDMMDVEVVTATVEITAFDGATVSGNVVATVAPNVDGISILAGEFTDIPFCDTFPPCG